MSTDIFDYNERLFGFVASAQLDEVGLCLIDGANPTKVSNFCGRTAVGQAALLGEAEILDLLLKSCEDKRHLSNLRLEVKTGSDGTNRKDDTPDDMSQLEWDDEFHNSNSFVVSSVLGTDDLDECSSLYKYYAKKFETLSTVSLEPDTLNDLRFASPYCLDALGMTPMHYVSACGHLNCLEVLLKHNAPVDVTTNEGLTPLHMGVANEMVVRLLLAHKADPNRKTFTKRETPLHFAIRRRNLVAVNLLLQAGAKINSVDNVEQTPLMSAIVNGLNEIAICLIDNGCKLNMADRDGLTALQLAVNINNVTIASYLLEKGARLLTSRCPLHHCIKEDMTRMAEVLIQRGDVVTLNIRDSFGCTPLILAIMYGRETILKSFLSDVTHSKPLQRSDNELFYAVQYIDKLENFRNVIRILMTHGGVPLNKSKNVCCEETLSRAVAINKFHFAEFLIKEGIDVSTICRKHVLSKLSLASDKSHVDLAIMLIHAGFKIDNNELTKFNGKSKNCFRKSLEQCVHSFCRSTLSLQSLTRIRIRNCLIQNLNSAQRLTTANYNNSLINEMIDKIDIPKPMQSFLSDFDDLPKISGGDG